MMAVNALWDTGSTESLISEKIVKMIEPILKNKSKYVTRDVVIECETYAVSLSLSDEITFRDVLMKKSDLSDKNVDIIIGIQKSRNTFYNGCSTYYGSLLWKRCQSCRSRLPQRIRQRSSVSCE